MAYTDIDDPSLHFNTVLYTGNGGTNAITGVGFQPDWVSIKRRSGSASNGGVFDVLRGVTKLLSTSLNDAEDTRADSLTAFGTDGFTLGGDTGNYVNTNSETFVSWNWKAGGSGSSNSDGDITSSVSANTTAGFSIMTYTGTGSNNTVGHGLNSAPTFTIIRRRDSNRNWFVSIVPYTGDTGYLYLHTTTAGGSSGQSFFTARPTNSVMNLGTDQDANISSGSYIAYNFHDVQGYSKFGSYTGNGNADGTFVYTGFRPAWVMIKRTDSTGDWHIQDNKRDTFNPVDTSLFANTSDADTTSSSYYTDFLSNGFKLRGTTTARNGSGNSYIYMAFAEAPFTNSSGVPCNAR